MNLPLSIIHKEELYKIRQRPHHTDPTSTIIIVERIPMNNRESEFLMWEDLDEELQEKVSNFLSENMQ